MVIIGITSACAEQTFLESTRRPYRRDHLRVCGADPAGTNIDFDLTGSPPRVRSRLGRGQERLRVHGITSACAEQTRTETAAPASQRDHLRVCGADTVYDCSRVSPVGSPPRVRSRRPSCQWIIEHSGITSACAEQTALSMARLMVAWDHLRVCGADSS